MHTVKLIKSVYKLVTKNREMSEKLFDLVDIVLDFDYTFIVYFL